MIAEWMLYCALCSLALLTTAAVVERWLLAGGVPVRHVWSVALLLSLAIPVATYSLAPRQTITIPAAPISAIGSADLNALAGSTPVGQAPQSLPARDQSFRKLIPANRVAIAAWAALSAALAIYFVAGLAALVRMRRQWRVGDVCGVKVLVSDRTGPAVINPFSPQIVMPEWALTMDRYQLGLMIRHEQEHRRAGDPQLLALAQVALIAMPWNPALWWGVVRLGLAVELDCDARVLRTADPRTYGDLLLEVARPRRGPRLVATAAFAERAGGLERRIRAIAGRRDRIARGARAGAALVGLATIGIAWVAPHPSLPPRLTIAPPTIVSVTPAASAALENKKPAQLVPVRPESLESRQATRSIRRTSVLLPPMKVGDGVRVGTPRPVFSPLDSLIYDRLFNGVVLSPDQEIAARLLLSSLSALQTKQDQAMVVANVQTTVARIRLNQERDSSLLALVSNDVDRDVLAGRLNSMQLGGGRRGRSSNPTSEVPAGPTGGQRGGARGRVGGGGSSLPAAPASGLVDDAIFGILFNGISLSPDQDAAGRSILTAYRQKVAATIPEPMPFQLRLQGTTDVLMRPESRAALLAILANDADRAVVDSRILTDVRIVNRQLPPPSD
jgi:beta-lactamase regulating signal transducer with metallopeptidase domain